MTRVFERLSEWRAERAAWDVERCTVGFVPTMGALHAGHRALLARARAENDRVVLSIFVNPTQFNDPADLQGYPRTRDADLALTKGLADAMIVPAEEEMYPDEYHYRLTESTLSSQREGAQRPGHFEGMLTVVLKLLNLVQPHRAYFGEKDWQQLQLVRGMVQAFLPVEIVSCATIREDDGLALSSRNRRLSSTGRRHAAVFPRILRESPDAAMAAKALGQAGFRVDYVEDYDGVRLGAVRLEGVRLIDNVRL
jgi:pantoate--beta-alanine ligase